GCDGRENVGAGERVATSHTRERIGELSAGETERRHVRRIGGPPFGVKQLVGIVDQRKGGTKGLLAVALGIPRDAEPRRNGAPMGSGESLAIFVLGVSIENQARRRRGIHGAMPALFEEVPIELVAAPVLVIRWYAGFPTQTEVDGKARGDVEGILRVGGNSVQANVVGNHLAVGQSG